MLNRILKYSVKNILRNKFLSISSVLVLTLLMFFINILLVLHDVSFKIIDSISSKLTISLYLKEDYDENSVDYLTLKENIKNVNLDISVDYKKKDVLMEEIREREPDLVKILENTNPLPDAINLSNISLNDYDKLNMVIENKNFMFSINEDDEDYFSNYKVQYQNIQSLIGILSKTMLGLYFVIIIFLVSISIIVYSIIGNFIYYYKDEIYITKLVGGGNMFIYGPFVSQGILYSIASFFISTFVFIFLVKNLETIIGNIYIYHFDLKLFLFQLLVFILIGAISGYFSSKKYLKK